VPLTPRDNFDEPRLPVNDAGIDLESLRSDTPSGGSTTTEIAPDEKKPRKVIPLPEPPVQEPAEPSPDNTEKPRRVIELPPPPIDDSSDEIIDEEDSTDSDGLPTTENADPPDIDDIDQLATSRLGRWWRAIGRRLSSSFTISLIFHVALLLTLAMIAIGGTQQGGPITLNSFTEEPIFLEPLDGTELEITPTEPYDPIDADMTSEVDTPAVTVDLLEMTDIASQQPDQLYRGNPETSATDMMMPTKLGGGFEGRGAMKQQTGADRGMTEGTENAVKKGLRWLAAHQSDNGAWYFDLQRGPCQGRCSGSGSEISSTAATAIVLLPFLGAGHTHKKEGEYKSVVNRGL